MPNSYDPFGNTASAGRTIEQFFSLQFSTKCGDPGMDLHDYGHRFYSPTLGRFLNPDPLSGEGDANFFSSVFDSPVNQIDPLGLFGCTPSPPADPPGKPADCDKPCSCDRPDGSKGVLKCQHVSASYTVTGGWTNWWNHQKYKWMKHPPDRIGKPEYWNPTYCFDDPKCPDGWNAKSPHYYDAQSGTDISAGGGNYPRAFSFGAVR